MVGFEVLKLELEKRRLEDATTLRNRELAIEEKKAETEEKKAETARMVMEIKLLQAKRDDLYIRGMENSFDTKHGFNVFNLELYFFTINTPLW